MFNFRVKTIESCSSGASTSGVDIFRFCICVATLPAAVRICIRAEEHLLTSLRVLLAGTTPSHQTRTQTFHTQTLDFAVTVMKCLETGNTERSLSSLGCSGRNRRRKPTFFFFFFREGIVFSLLLLQLLFKFSVYVKDWAATCSTDLLQAICRAGFSSVSTAPLKDCTLFVQKRG